MGLNCQNVKICSINVWGIRDEMKRRKLYAWLEEGKYDVIFLQETHCMMNDPEIFDKGWHGTVYHSPTDSKNSRGVAIAFANKFNHSLLKYSIDKEGRKILVNIEHAGNNLAFANLYAPNNQKDRKNYFSKCLTWINKHNLSGSNIIVGGDMNCCLKNNDRYPVTHLQDKSRKAFKELIDMLDLKDCWEGEREENMKYTWYNSDKSIMSRLDYVLVGSDSLYKKKDTALRTVITSEIGKRITDHKAVIVTLVMEGYNRGPGYWKLNTAHLKCEEYITGVNKTIDRVLKEFECSNICKRLVWDLLKLKIKEYTILYCKNNAIKNKSKISELEKEIKLTRNSQEAKNIEAELDSLYSEKAKGAQIRSRAKWVEEGEKNSNYCP